MSTQLMSDALKDCRESQRYVNGERGTLMAVNVNSEIGQAEDMIRSYVQFGCAEIHAMGLYFKISAEMDNGLVDVSIPNVLQECIDKANEYQEDIAIYAGLRRDIMRKLLSMFDGGNKDMWCQAKHLGIAAMTLFEAYQASDDDPELLNMAYEANKAFVKAISRFLGVEVTDCAACLSDAIKGVTDNTFESKGEV